MSKKPAVIVLDKPKGRKPLKAKIMPSTAPTIPETLVGAETVLGDDMVTRLAVYKPSFMTKIFWAALISFIGFFVSVAFWDFASDMMLRNFWMGRIAIALIGILGVCVVVYVLREWANLSRVRRIDDLREQSEAVQDLDAARYFTEQVQILYKGRSDLKWAFANMSERRADALDADAQMHLVETTVMSPLDTQAQKTIESAARQVATVTAIIPLALADVAVALVANMRMIRNIAEIYGGRSSFLGSWRLMRIVAAHMIATGAVAIGDDMISAIAGGGVLSKISRRFGEGIINGALTARVGLAAMDVCRPMSFRNVKKPTVTGLMKDALVGFAARNS